MSALHTIDTKPGDVFYTVGRNPLLVNHLGTWTIVGEGLDTRPGHLGKPVVIFTVTYSNGHQKLTMMRPTGFKKQLRRGSIKRRMTYVNPKQTNVFEGDTT